MRLEISLNTRSLNHAIGELKRYKLNLESKTQIFLDRLLEEGIRVAEMHTGRYTGYIAFEKDIKVGKKVCVGVLTGLNTKPFISTWKVKGGKKSVEVNALLMAEFGSGWLANVIWNVPGVGQGTFPGQTHATDPGGWWWEDEDGTKHHSIGEAPYYPMYSAEMAMLEKIDSIAREVFNGI